VTKIVFSKTLKESNWANTRFYDQSVTEVARQLKQQASSDILVLGSGSIMQQLAKEGLIDEYIFIVTPVVAGEGKPLFPVMKQFDLSLVQAQTFESGNLVTHYALKR